MAKYKAYPEYKDSGVEWLGEIPKHWQRFPLKYLVEMKSGESITAADIEPEGNYPVFGGNGLRGYSSKYTHSGSYVLIGRQGALCGNVNYAHNQFWASEHALVVKGKKSFNIRWLGELLRAMNLNQYSITAAQPGLSAEALVNLQIPVPPEAEREAVASFIGYEAGKIDNLIEKQQQLIELLKEKRQAVISHAVTKGLNPSVSMKNSGVEWLGEVPEHWKIKRCKNLFDFVTSGSRGWAGFYSDEGDLFFRIANLTRDSINPKLDSIQYVTPPKGSEGERSKIKENDLLISITADLGSVCAADESISGGYVSQHVSLCRPGRLVASSRWLAFFVLSDTAKEQLQGAGYGGTKVQLSLEDIRDLFVAYPPKSEQIKIASYLDERLSELDGLDQRAHNLIELLRERRTALISAAVTGKIDVRDWVAPDTQDVEAIQEATA